MEFMGRSFDEVVEKSLEKQRNTLSELPEVVRIAIGRVLEAIENGLTQNKAPDNIMDNYGDHNYNNDFINVIPSNQVGPCSPLLITFCFDGDKFDVRIKTSLDHATKDCRGICRKIFFLTTQWNSWMVKDTAGYISSVRDNGVAISFIHITPQGIVVMPT